MSSYQLTFVLLCVSLSVAPWFCSASTAEGSCEYLYIEQPPNELECNPYVNKELRLECTVEVPLDSNESVVNWFHSVSPTLPPNPCSMNQLSTNVTESIFVLTMPSNIRNGRRFVRTQLRVRDLTDSHVGSYWCKVEYEGQNGLLPSDLVFLKPAAVYANFLPCPTNQAVSKQENKCAVPLQPSRVDSSGMHIPPTTIGSFSDVYRLQSTDSVRPTVTAGFHHSVTSMQISKVQSSIQHGTMSLRTSVTYASPTVMVPPLGEVPDADSSEKKQLLKLYIAIGVLGFTTVLILVLLIVSVGLFLRKHHWKRTDGDRHHTSTPDSVCESPPVDLLSSTSTNEYCCSHRSSSAAGMDLDSGCDSQPPSQRSTLPVPRLPVVFAQSTIPHGFEASINHSYESALTISRDHDYEDVTDFEDSGEYVQFPPVNMKRNPSYRALKLGTRLGVGGGRAPMPIVPNPLVMRNPALCDDEPCAHDYLVPVSSSNSSASTSQE